MSAAIGRKNTSLTLALVSSGLREFRLHRFPRPQAAPVAEDNLFSVFQPGEHFRAVFCLYSQRDFTVLDFVVRIDDHHASGAAPLVYRLNGNHQRIAISIERER